jgi:hypothetical protein
MPKEKNRQIGENSPSLVTLLVHRYVGRDTAEKREKCSYLLFSQLPLLTPSESQPQVVHTKITLSLAAAAKRTHFPEKTFFWRENRVGKQFRKKPKVTN